MTYRYQFLPERYINQPSRVIISEIVPDNRPSAANDHPSSVANRAARYSNSRGQIGLRYRRSRAPKYEIRALEELLPVYLQGQTVQHCLLDQRLSLRSMNL